MRVLATWLVCLSAAGCADDGSAPAQQPPAKSADDSGRALPIEARETAVAIVLRQLVAAQAQFQAAGFADENRNGIGEYGGFGELVGRTPVRGAKALDRALLPPAFRDIRSGVVRRVGYVFRMGLPTKRGYETEQRDGGYAAGRVDAARAETLWRCHAWPETDGATGRVFFVDQSGDVMRTVKASALRPTVDYAPDRVAGGWEIVR